MRSVRARLTLYYTLALACILLLFTGSVYLLVRHDLQRQMRIQLGHDLWLARSAAGRDAEDVGEIERQAGVELFRLNDGGRVLVTTRDWRELGLDAAFHAVKHGGPVWTWESPKHRIYYLRSAVMPTGAEEDERVTRPPYVQVTVARDGGMLQRTLSSLLTMMLIGLAFGIGLALLGGYFMAGRVLRPIGAMASKAQAVTADRLSERLPVHNSEDELGRLALAFNSTLARLQDSFDRLRRFTSDASHELRTPLAAIKSVGEVALRNGSDPSSCREAVSSMLEETDKLTSLVDNLLMLTRADAGTAKLSWEQTDLGALVSEAVECLRVLADEKGLGISVELDETVTANVDRSTLRQAVMNLLDNAIKYTPEGGHICVSVRRSDARAVIEVADSGPGIPEEHVDKVFERFHRVEKSRSEAPGVGLGLAIAKWAVEANGGTIELESQERKGSTFRIVFPHEGLLRDKAPKPEHHTEDALGDRKGG